MEQIDKGQRRKSLKRITTVHASRRHAHSLEPASVDRLTITSDFSSIIESPTESFASSRPFDRSINLGCGM